MENFKHTQKEREGKSVTNSHILITQVHVASLVSSFPKHPSLSSLNYFEANSSYFTQKHFGLCLWKKKKRKEKNSFSFKHNHNIIITPFKI